MRERTVRGTVVGIGVLTVVGGVHRLVTIPEVPEQDEGLVGFIVRTAVEDFAEVLEWMATTAVVNSVLLVLVGVALIVLGLNIDMDTE